VQTDGKTYLKSKIKTNRMTIRDKEASRAKRADGLTER
jgi:hypothetical protein